MPNQPTADEADASLTPCSCGNSFDGDNFCMPSACQWEGLPASYGPDDDCETCGIPASECGHVRPETPDD